MKNIGTIALLFILIIGAYFIGANQEKAYTGEYKTYTISRGDTIWSIAEDIDGNTEQIVYLIRKDNGIKDCGTLQIGQEIQLRVEY